MPILAISPMGTLYETDPDSPDGTGCKCKPPKSGSGDMTLGKAYLDSERRRDASELQLQTAQAIEDHRDLRSAKMARRSQALKGAAEERRAAFASNPFNKLRLLRAAAKQSLNGHYEDRIGLSGVGLSPDGMPGTRNQMTRQQIGYEIALRRKKGMGENIELTTQPASVKTPTINIPKKSLWSIFTKAPVVSDSSGQPITQASASEMAQQSAKKSSNTLLLMMARANESRANEDANNLMYDSSTDEEVTLAYEQTCQAGATMGSPRFSPNARTNPLLRLRR